VHSVVFFAPFLLLGVALVGGGLLVVRSTRSTHRVPIQGVVVALSRMTRPAMVTVEYPAPDGSPLRARRAAGALAGLSVGGPITVQVDPRNPRDVSLGSGGAAATYGWAMVAMGVFAILGTLRGVAWLDR
jgi:hypothetical protein